MATQVTRLGPFTRWEKQPALEVTFQDATQTAIDISGFDVEATWKVLNQSPPDTPNTFACTLSSDGTDGKVTVPWGTANPSPFSTVGTVELEVWASNGTVRYASEIFRFYVRAAVATTEPSI